MTKIINCGCKKFQKIDPRNKTRQTNSMTMLIKTLLITTLLMTLINETLYIYFLSVKSIISNAIISNVTCMSKEPK